MEVPAISCTSVMSLYLTCPRYNCDGVHDTNGKNFIQLQPPTGGHRRPSIQFDVSWQGQEGQALGLEVTCVQDESDGQHPSHSVRC